MHFYSFNCLSYLNLVGGLSCMGSLTLLQTVAIVIDLSFPPFPCPPAPPPLPLHAGLRSNVIPQG